MRLFANHLLIVLLPRGGHYLGGISIGHCLLALQAICGFRRTTAIRSWIMQSPDWRNVMSIGERKQLPRSILVADALPCIYTQRTVTGLTRYPSSSDRSASAYGQTGISQWPVIILRQQLQFTVVQWIIFYYLNEFNNRYNGMWRFFVLSCVMLGKCCSCAVVASYSNKPIIHKTLCGACKHKIWHHVERRDEAVCAVIGTIWGWALQNNNNTLGAVNVVSNMQMCK